MSQVQRENIADQYKWDLTRIYQDQTKFEKEFSEVNELCKELVSFKGKIMDNAENLYQVLTLDRQIEEKIARLYIYANLKYYEDMTNNQAEELAIRAENLNDDISIKTSFVTPEILKADYKPLIKAKKELEQYEFMLEKLYRYQEYTLSEKEEELLANATSAMGTGDNAYSKLNNADIDLGYIKNEQGKLVKLNNQLYSDFVRSHDRNLRKRAFKKMYEFYEKHKFTISALYAGEVKETAFVAKTRKFNSSLEQSMYADNIDVFVYKNLIKTTHDNLPTLHKYFKVKEKMLNISKMHIYDVYAEPKFENEEHIEYSEAINIINEALKPLGEAYIKDLNRAYTEKWIDVYPNRGKRSGAFQWGPYQIPFVMLNYNYKIDDVATLAHELGHAMHTYYSDNNQSTIYNNYPIFLAEIASTVNEVLLTNYLLKTAETKEEKVRYLLDFLEKTRATIYRQVMYAEFEMMIHDFEQQNIPLTEELMSNTFYNLNQKYFGKNIIIDNFIRYEWMRMPHLYKGFYVYKYATGLASAMAITSDILNNKPHAQENYLEFLKSGCSKYPLDTLKITGVDLTNSNTIQKAFDMFEEKVLELESLVNE